MQTSRGRRAQPSLFLFLARSLSRYADRSRAETLNLIITARRGAERCVSCGVARGTCFKLHHYILSHTGIITAARQKTGSERPRGKCIATFWMLRERETIIGQRVGTRHLKYFATSEHDGPWERHSALSNAHIHKSSSPRHYLSCYRRCKC
jgi:hypothetical protein